MKMVKIYKFSLSLDCFFSLQISFVCVCLHQNVNLFLLFTCFHVVVVFFFFSFCYFDLRIVLLFRLCIV